MKTIQYKNHFIIKVDFANGHFWKISPTQDYSDCIAHRFDTMKEAKKFIHLMFE